MTLLEKINSIRVKSTTVTFGGISLELGLKESEGIKQVHLQELLKMRNMVSFFYFTMNHKKMTVIDEDDEEQIIRDVYDEAVETYKNLSEFLLGSEYFFLLEFEKRNHIIESFDYLWSLEAYALADEDNILDINDMAPIIDNLIELFIEIDNLVSKYVLV